MCETGTQISVYIIFRFLEFQNEVEGLRRTETNFKIPVSTEM